jgi:hypothetical protein
VIATNGLAATYYLGRFDVEFSASHLSEVEGGAPFSIDHRTGRPIISEARSLRQLMACYPTGLVISEGWQWKNRIVGIDAGSADLLVRETERVELPPEANLLAFRWRWAGEQALDGACRSLRERVGGPEGPASPPGAAPIAG